MDCLNMALQTERCREVSVAVLAHSMIVYFPCLSLQLHVMFCVVHQIDVALHLLVTKLAFHHDRLCIGSYWCSVARVLPIEEVFN